MKKIELFLLSLIILGAFFVRLYRFNNPVADWHSWRQADTSAVSRNFVKQGFDLLHPKFDDISNVASGKDNPNGYRFVEFPIYNFFQAGLFKLIGIFSLEGWGRLVTIFSSIVSIIFIYLIVKKYSTAVSALFASFFFAFLPFNIYFGRTILPDSMMVMAILGGIFFFDKWTSSIIILRAKPRISSEARSFALNKVNVLRMTCFFLSIIFTASAFLLKPYALFFTLPIIYLAFKTFGIRTFLKWEIWFFTILTLAPLVFWRFWMQQYPEGIPDSIWLFNKGGIRFKGAFFQWLFGDRVGRLILAYWGLPLFVLGAIGKLKIPLKNTFFFFSFLISSILYMFIIAGGNVQHDYYQILIIPSLVIFLGLGAEFLIKAPKEYFHKTIGYLLLTVSVSFMFSFGWYFIRDFFNINNPSMVRAGKEIDLLIPKEAKVLAIYNGDTSFLYQVNRKGWASFEKSLPEMIEMGASYLILPNPQEKDYGLGNEYRIISSTPDYVLFDLNSPPGIEIK